MEIATNIAIIATTTKSSTKVKPLSRTFFFIRTHVSLSSYICSVHNYIKFYRNVNTNEEHTLAGVMEPEPIELFRDCVEYAPWCVRRLAMTVFL